jgi:hypothetical protein
LEYLAIFANVPYLSAKKKKKKKRRTEIKANHQVIKNKSGKKDSAG